MKPEYVSDRRCALGVAKRSEDNTKRETWVGERSKAEQRISFSSFHGQLTHGNSTPRRRFRLIHGQFHSYASTHASGVARMRRSRSRCVLSGWRLELLTHIDIAAAVERENTCCDDIRWRLLLLPFAQLAPSLCQISSVSWLLCWVCFTPRKNLSIERLLNRTVFFEHFYEWNWLRGHDRRRWLLQISRISLFYRQSARQMTQIPVDHNRFHASSRQSSDALMQIQYWHRKRFSRISQRFRSQHLGKYLRRESMLNWKFLSIQLFDVSGAKFDESLHKSFRSDCVSIDKEG